MRYFKTKQSYQNMCASCAYCSGSCDEISPKYGDGLGNDNVIECSSYYPDSICIPNFIVEVDIDSSDE